MEELQEYLKTYTTHTCKNDDSVCLVAPDRKDENNPFRINSCFFQPHKENSCQVLSLAPQKSVTWERNEMPELGDEYHVTHLLYGATITLFRYESEWCAASRKVLHADSHYWYYAKNLSTHFWRLLGAAFNTTDDCQEMLDQVGAPNLCYSFVMQTTDMHFPFMNKDRLYFVSAVDTQTGAFFDHTKMPEFSTYFDVPAETTVDTVNTYLEYKGVNVTHVPSGKRYRLLHTRAEYVKSILQGHNCELNLMHKNTNLSSVLFHYPSLMKWQGYYLMILDSLVSVISSMYRFNFQTNPAAFFCRRNVHRVLLELHRQVVQSGQGRNGPTFQFVLNFVRDGHINSLWRQYAKGVLDACVQM